MAKTESHIPKLCFAGFTDPWQKKFLEKIADKIGDGIHATPIYSDEGEVPFINGNNLVNNAVFITENTKKISCIEFKKYTQYLNSRSLFMSINGTIGNMAFYNNEIVLLGKSICYININEKFNTNYLFYYLLSPKIIKDIEQSLTGSTIKNLSLKTIRSLKINFPEFKEQNKIGDFFQKIDQVIELQQKSLETARDYKKSMLQKMFPQKGEKVPKVRFEGFSGDWEEKKLSNIAKITMGQSPDSANYTENSQDHILVQGNADLKKGFVVPRIYTTQVTKKADKGDIILTVRAPVGAIAFTDFDVVLGRGVAGIKGNLFTYYILELINMLGIWERFSSGSTFDSINSNQIKQIDILVPQPKEQQKIGAFFQKLDQQIEKHEKKLESYQSLKKAMLQRMFV